MAQTSLEISQHSLSLGLKSMGSKEYESEGENTLSRPPVEFVFANTSNNHGPSPDSTSKFFVKEERYDQPYEDVLQKTNSKGSAMIMLNRTSRSPSVTSASGQDVIPNGLSLSSSGNLSKYRARRRGSSSRADRDAYLEVVKNKSWSNLSGYDSDRPKSRENNIFLNILKQSIETENQDDITRKIFERRKSCSGSDFESKKPNDPHNRYAHYNKVLKRKSLSETSSLPQSLDDSDRDRKLQNQQGTIITEKDLFDPYNESASDSSSDRRQHLEASGSNSHRTSSTHHSPHGTIIVETDDFSDLRDTQPHFFSSRNSTSIFSPKSNRTRKINFSTVEVRQYERILGDNPSCSSGAPVSIGWKFFQERTLCLPVDEYEYYHGHFRDECDMVLDRQERETLLYELGYSEKDLAKVVRENVKMKKNRRQTVNNLPVMKIEVAVESITKKLTGAFRSKDKSMNKYGDNFHASASSSLSGNELKSCLKTNQKNFSQSDSQINS